MSDNLQLESTPPEQSSVIEESITEIPPQPKPSPLVRLGCGALLVIWFTILLMPFALFYLATTGEIRIEHNDIPDPYEHPRLSIELVTEADSRGLRIVNSAIVDNAPDDDALCIQTNVRFLLWQTNEENQDVSYCDCYVRSNADAEWTFDQTTPDACPVGS